MTAAHAVFIPLLVAIAVAQSPSPGDKPVDKVITLLEDLKTDIETEAKGEATTYDKFACFCKDKTKDKSKSITDSQDKIDTLSADIQSNTATRAEKAKDLAKRKKDDEAWKAELSEVQARCMAKITKFEAKIADLEKAIDQLGKAIKSIEDTKPTFLQMSQMSEVKDTLALADALGFLSAPHQQRKLTAFLQQDPHGEYEFGSQGILDMLEKVDKDFKDNKKDEEDELKDVKKDCDDEKGTLGKQITKNGKKMKTLSKDIDKLTTKIADDRKDLVTEEETLKDDELYMKDLTERCEDKAKVWDQRAQMRNDEIEAISEALSILQDGPNSVKKLDAVNNRSLLEVPDVTTPAPLQSATSAPKSSHGAGPRVSHANVTAAAVKQAKKLLSFLQEATTKGGLHLKSKLVIKQQVSKSLRGWGAGPAASLLKKEGARIRSTMLSSVAEQLMKDPFAKVKELIQNLIQRLLKEATAEAEKKGFCDSELGVAKQERDGKFNECAKLDAAIGELEAKKDELEDDITELEGDIEDLWTALNKSRDLRADEKKENLKNIKTAKEGYKAVTEAIVVLKAFYRESAKTKLALVQASPVDDDAPDAGFDTKYKGNQESSRGIIAILEVIQSDFDRTKRKTEEAEEKAQADFVDFDRTSRTDISGKETKVELNKQDLEDTKDKIKTTLDDLDTAQGLLDAAIKTIEDLKPMCIDTGMSWDERVQKRKDEIDALKQALCILDPDGVEPDCGGR